MPATLSHARGRLSHPRARVLGGTHHSRQGARSAACQPDTFHARRGAPPGGPSVCGRYTPRAVAPPGCSAAPSPGHGPPRPARPQSTPARPQSTPARPQSTPAPALGGDKLGGGVTSFWGCPPGCRAPGGGGRPWGAAPHPGHRCRDLRGRLLRSGGLISLRWLPHGIRAGGGERRSESGRSRRTGTHQDLGGGASRGAGSDSGAGMRRGRGFGWSWAGPARRAGSEPVLRLAARAHRGPV